MKAGTGLTLFMLLCILCSCKQIKKERNIERSFYYWKSVLQITPFEKQRLDSLQVKTLYLKFFDVDWDEEFKRPKPLAKIRIADSAYKDFSVIPAIFITNACIQKIDTGQVKELAQNLIQLINGIALSNNFNDIPEIQFDCDWTASTKEKYFALLNEFKTLKPDKKLSVTIRLHQIKYISKSGIPPVHRGLLMCYNMGNLKDPATNNSIIETAELKKYIGGLAKYPLPLDIAFPLFDWKVLYRNNMYKGLIQHLPEAVFSNSFSEKEGNRFRILKDTLLQGYDLRKGDMIRNEQSEIKEILLTASEISNQIKNTRLRVSLYHLDSLTLSKYTTHELESIYNSMH